ncbi:hypothetical protein EIN_283790 [Entamoeba invadens IP1]|uniref:FHA domain-containing protein n=1 Tax=Entamoeba invadens IP1 TaxID=370355 RepID=L7FLV2_ENTIV|nr:hypothetical protein EIN_283790 [Entamoeba invadens IP1]ELP84833.1 hypothetical protein EIN_283790 [Entamoeba invadens IP1]|eukprot:XP_004184179.1 hypothetical protein EIN_283790 [Entamoeba invadens IP1]
MTPVLQEYATWMKMKEVKEESIKLKEQIPPNNFLKLLQVQVIQQYKESLPVRQKLTPLVVTLKETLKDVKQHAIERKEPKPPKAQRKKLKKRLSEEEDPAKDDEKKSRKRRHNKAKLIGENGQTIIEFDSKTVYPVVFGRAKDTQQSDNPSFINLSKYTKAKSLSHRHATITYEKETDTFQFVNEGRNGSGVNSSLVVKKENKVQLNDKATLEMGTFKMTFHII